MRLTSWRIPSCVDDDCGWFIVVSIEVYRDTIEFIESSIQFLIYEPFPFTQICRKVFTSILTETTFEEEVLVANLFHERIDGFWNGDCTHTNGVENVDDIVSTCVTNN